MVVAQYPLEWYNCSQSDMKTETWKPVVGFPGYEVSSAGRVRSIKRKNWGGDTPAWKILKTRLENPGRKPRRHRRLVIDLCRDGRKYQLRIHVLVLEAFIGPRPVSLEACHKSDDKSDNSLSNLYWGTKADNIADRDRNGRVGGIKGERHHNTKFTASQVLEIVALRQQGLTYSAIAKIFDVSRACISNICHGLVWSHVTGILKAA